MLNKKVFTSSFIGLCELFEREATESLGGMYYDQLKDMSDDEFRSAINKVCQSVTFHKMPLPAEIRQSAFGKLEDRATLALVKVERAVREVGGYSTIIFDDPIIHKVISSFDNGWIGICDMTVEEWTWARKDFVRMYQAFSAGGFQSVPHKLIGRIQFDNESRGFQSKFPTVYFGGKAPALEWQKKVPDPIMIEDDILRRMLKNDKTDGF